MKTAPGWLRRGLALTAALVLAKLWCVGTLIELETLHPLWSLIALLSRSTLTVMLIGGIDLFLTLRARRAGDPEQLEVAERAGTLLVSCMVLWVAMSIPTTITIGAVPGWVEFGDAGGVGVALLTGLDPISALGVISTLFIAIWTARRANRWPSGRTKLGIASFILSFGFLGSLARRQVSHHGLERDPIGYLIESFWTLVQTPGAGA